MVRLLVIADDLTGAADTGVQFAKRGIGTLVTVDRDIDFTSLDPELAVLVVDTESRHVSPEEAAQRVGSVARRARQAGVEHFYKKTDSTLRGNVGAELEALMRALDSSLLAFIPAYPGASRTTRGGYQYVGGVLLAESAFGRGPVEVADESFVPAVLAKQTALDVRVISPRGGEGPGGMADFERGIAVFDCENDDDLVRIAQILAANDALCVTAGPAGFAEVLPEFLAMPERECAVETNDAPLLVVGGSVNEVSLRQVAFARRLGFVDVALPAGVADGGEAWFDREGEALAEKAVLAASGGASVVVCARGESECEVSGLLSERIARFVAHVLPRAPLGGCAVFGGDTALAVMKALGCVSLVPSDEIVPGVVLSRLVGASSGIDFLTKAGGFGDQDVVRRIVEYLREFSRR